MIGTSISVPKTYSDWVEILDMLMDRTNDEEILEAMQKGTVEWQTGVAERFSKKLIDTVNCRMNYATEKFQKEMLRSNGQERAIVQALLALRKEFLFLSKVITLPAIPEKDREHYYSLVISQADSVQHSLEDSAKKDRTGKLASIVRNNKVNSF